MSAPSAAIVRPHPAPRGGGHAARAIATRNAFRERDVSLLRNNVTSVNLDETILESVSTLFPPLATPKAVLTQARRPPRLPRHRSPMPRADHTSMRRRGFWIWRRRAIGVGGVSVGIGWPYAVKATLLATATAARQFDASAPETLHECGHPFTRQRVVPPRLITDWARRGPDPAAAPCVSEVREAPGNRRMLRCALYVERVRDVTAVRPFEAVVVCYGLVADWALVA